jgi:hypothetical protein
MNIVKSIAVLASVFALVSCSPYAYKQEIGAFDSGVNSVVASYETGRQAVNDIYAQRRQQAFVTGRVRIHLLKDCDPIVASGNPPAFSDCDLAQYPATAPPPKPEMESTIASAAPTFDALKRYAAALTAVTTASDDAQLNNASQSLVSSIGSLDTAVAAVAPNTASSDSKISAGATLFGQITTLYLDSRRYVVLRKVVPVVDPSITTLAGTAQKALVDIQRERLLQLKMDMRAAEKPLGSPNVSTMSATEYQADLLVLQAKIATFNQIRSVNPQSTVAALKDAHHKLAQALQDDSGDAPSVYAAMIIFLNSAAQIQSAFSTAPSTATPASINN